MSLVYRSIWTDTQPNAINAAEAQFERWLTDEFGPTTTSAAGQQLFDDGTSIEVELRSAKDETTQVIESIARFSTPDSTTTTTMRVIEASGQQIVWVDVDLATEHVWDRPKPVAPKLVNLLIAASTAAGGQAKWSVGRLQATPIAVRDVAKEALSLIRSPLREIPVVVVTHDHLSEAAENIARAKSAAEQLAGIAIVLFLPDTQTAAFNRLIGEPGRIEYGEARLFLPGPIEKMRNRKLPVETVRRSQSEIGHRFAQLLAPSLVAKRAPDVWDEVRRLLDEQNSETSEVNVELAQDQVASLTEALEESRSKFENAEHELVDTLADLELLQADMRDLRKKYDFVVNARTGQQLASVEEAERPPTTMSEAIELARANLEKLSIPASATRSLHELERQIHTTVWAESTLRGLVALNAYASERPRFVGDFWLWCEQSNSPLTWHAHPAKLAMSESDSVMRDERLREARMLPVDESLNPDGKTLMQAHLKIASRAMSPRVYFHDDTGGETGLIHIGFIGPHSKMPTATDRH